MKIRKQDTISQAVARIDEEIANLQRMRATLLGLTRDTTMGRPRERTLSDEQQVADLIAQGKTHRQIAKLLRMPVSTVGQLARRVGAKRAGSR